MDRLVLEITGMVMLIFFIDNSNEMTFLPKSLLQDFSWIT